MIFLFFIYFIYGTILAVVDLVKFIIKLIKHYFKPEDFDDFLLH